MGITITSVSSGGGVLIASVRALPSFLDTNTATLPIISAVPGKFINPYLFVLVLSDDWEPSVNFGFGESISFVIGGVSAVADISLNGAIAAVSSSAQSQPIQSSGSFGPNLGLPGNSMEIKMNNLGGSMNTGSLTAYVYYFLL